MLPPVALVNIKYGHLVEAPEVDAIPHGAKKLRDQHGGTPPGAAGLFYHSYLQLQL